MDLTVRGLGRRMKISARTTTVIKLRASSGDTTGVDNAVYASDTRASSSRFLRIRASTIRPRRIISSVIEGRATTSMRAQCPGTCALDDGRGIARSLEATSRTVTANLALVWEIT